MVVAQTTIRSRLRQGRSLEETMADMNAQRAGQSVLSERVGWHAWHMYIEERYIKLLEQEKPVLEALFVWEDDLNNKTDLKSALGKALHYLLEQWTYLVHYLDDGRLENSNNRVERSIKPSEWGEEIGCLPILWWERSPSLCFTV